MENIELDYHGVRLRMCEINMMLSCIKKDYEDGVISASTRPYFDDAIIPLKQNVAILFNIPREKFNWHAIAEHVHNVSHTAAEINNYVRSVDDDVENDWRSVNIKLH